MTNAPTMLADRRSAIKNPISRFAQFWTLIKPLQTGLLLATGVAGYMSAHTSANIPLLLVMTLSLFLAIGGSTIMNMWYDHDIDSKMKRTQQRPAASENSPRWKCSTQAWQFPSSVSAGRWQVDLFYGAVVFAGWFFDVAVYTLWLKRRTCWSTVWGGISGAMPILAGRVLAVGEIDSIGLLLAGAVLFWIPTHILTFSIKYTEDYLIPDLVPALCPDRIPGCQFYPLDPDKKQAAPDHPCSCSWDRRHDYFLLPSIQAANGSMRANFALVGLGGALMGLGGLLLSFLKAGRPVLSKGTILRLFPALLLLMTLCFVAGFRYG